jgi:hypothetical protein
VCVAHGLVSRVWRCGVCGLVCGVLLRGRQVGGKLRKGESENAQDSPKEKDDRRRAREDGSDCVAHGLVSRVAPLRAGFRLTLIQYPVLGDCQALNSVFLP